MPVNEITKQQMGSNSTEVKSPLTAGLRNPSPKSQGTRAGVLIDWREGSRKVGKPSSGFGKTLRDGR